MLGCAHVYAQFRTAIWSYGVFDIAARLVRFESFDCLTTVRESHTVQVSLIGWRHKKKSETEKDEDSGDGFDGPGGDGAGECAGARWKYGVPADETAE